jgi:hypothetical protein
MGGPSLLSLGHVQGKAAILTLPVTHSVVGSNRVKPCRIVVSGAGVDSVTISDYMGRRALRILRRPMLLSAELRALFLAMGYFPKAALPAAEVQQKVFAQLIKRVSGGI